MTFLSALDFHVARRASRRERRSALRVGRQLRRRYRLRRLRARRGSRSSPTIRRCSASEFRPFDPNQGNYILAASASVRRGCGRGRRRVPPRVAASERSSQAQPMDWNMVGGRVVRGRSPRRPTFDGRAATSGRDRSTRIVDYRWEVDGVRRAHAPDAAAADRHCWRPAPADRRRGRHARSGQSDRRAWSRGASGSTGREGALELFAGRRAANRLRIRSNSRQCSWITAGFRLFSPVTSAMP